MELVVVVALLAIVAGMAYPLLGSAREDAEKTAAKATMSAIRDAILGSPNMPGYPGGYEICVRVPDGAIKDARPHEFFSSIGH